jgi:hypothetical protein
VAFNRELSIKIHFIYDAIRHSRREIISKNELNEGNTTFIATQLYKV